MRRFLSKPLVTLPLILIFPVVQTLRRPDDALARCGPERWRISPAGVLTCGAGRRLTAPERLSLGLTVDANTLDEDDWRLLVGRTAAARLSQRRLREGRLCRWSLSELASELSEKTLDQLPAPLQCDPVHVIERSGRFPWLKMRGD
ncbi:hypothetical protein KKD52_16630 [Myxococcota bacterium]|jgi:hypothetical protein|nr:hypothetical protein [Myxococcota bacterium]MBU1413754.1 hypothetical protein [Myxococcota bacterium]MBU1511982.1 hypothetical protein [Myxococcota bacterium]PKN23994.1 MAG: hypothetical protein CVU65_13050 [Deltaproteobacteria bacterium HGW-Deltaproteobacteria-22]